MRFINPPFRICEKLIENVLLIRQTNEKCNIQTLLETAGKSTNYIKTGYNFLIDLNVLEEKDGFVYISSSYEEIVKKLNESGSSDYSAILKSAISKNSFFNEYTSLLNQGKTSKQSIKFLKSVHKINSNDSKIEKSLDSMLQYLSVSINKQQSKKSKIVIPDKSFLWINDDGHLMYDEEAHTNKIINSIKLNKNTNGHYVNPSRLEELKEVTSKSEYDLIKLIRLLEELNIAYSNESYFAVGMIVRSIIDHVPPIFGKLSFNEVTENYGTKSFKELLRKLNDSSRKISDSMLHTHIRKKEILPNETQVDFRSELDFLLGEIIRINK